MTGWSDWVDGELGGLGARGLLRELRDVTPVDAVHVTHQGKSLTLFSGNDYLGLSSHPRVREAVAGAIARYGMGPRGSALVCGYTQGHAALEAELAELKGTATALLFPTGYAANVGTIGALAGPGVTFFSDALNHASIIDGTRLARRQGAEVRIYRHADVAHLRALMDASDAPRKVIVTDTLFSMDGDLAPLKGLAELRDAHRALLMVDEAHATLVFGAHGGGVAEHLGVAGRVDLHVGTLSKAIGAQGGFVATGARLRSLLLNRGRSFVFSTALPVPVVEAARAAVRVACAEPDLRGRLWRHVDALSERLGRRLSSPIVPVILGDPSATMAAAARLYDAGFHVIAIRPPTVPPGTSRLRVALSASHSRDEVIRLGEVLRGLST